MSERDELMAILDADSMSDAGTTAEFLERIKNDPSDCWNNGPLADAIIAAGYRRIPDDCVVVSREDADTILDCCEYTKENVSWAWHKWDHGPAVERLKAALSATRSEEVK